jgi:hypothetical protein
LSRHWYNAIAAVPSQATSLAEIATLCHNPSDVEATKSALLKADWHPRLSGKQAEVKAREDEILDATKVEGRDDEIHDVTDDLKTTTSYIFERHDGSDLFISVSKTLEPVKPKFAACVLIDTRNTIVGDLAKVISVLKLEKIKMKRIGPSYFWEVQNDGKAYSLILPTHRHTKAYLTILSEITETIE